MSKVPKRKLEYNVEKCRITGSGVKYTAREKDLRFFGFVRLWLAFCCISLSISLSLWFCYIVKHTVYRLVIYLPARAHCSHAGPAHARERVGDACLQSPSAALRRYRAGGGGGGGE